jgi:TPR repeat protein
MAADQGDVQGQFNHGIFLKNGEGISRNFIEAAKYFKMSADQGHAGAQFHYGNCLYHGEGVPTNLSEGAK